LGLDVWSLPELVTQMASDRQRQATLEEERAVILQRSAVRRQVVAGLEGGRLGLLEAAAQFRDVDVATPDCLHFVRIAYPGNSDEERFCRQVICWARSEVKLRSPKEADRLAAQLEADLQEHLRRDGGVRLPESCRQRFPLDAGSPTR
jgi:hypothetical protein